MTGGGARFDDRYTRYQAERGAFRRTVRKIYLRRVLRWVTGSAIDFGCGVGGLLSLLPPGSVGYEVNEASVRYCRDRGLDVRRYRPEEDRYELRDCGPGDFGTLILSHVLEHIDAPASVLRTMARSCSRIGIRRLIVVVPGRKGFRHDPTHATFVDRDYLAEHGLLSAPGLRIAHESFFPLPWSWGGALFTYNEWMIVYDVDA